MTDTQAEAPAPVNYMRSPENLVVEVLPSAYDAVWKHKGFEAVSDEDGLQAVEAQNLAREQAETQVEVPEPTAAPVPTDNPVPATVPVATVKSSVPPRPVIDNPQA